MTDARTTPPAQVGEPIALIDGTVVDSCDPRWLAETTQRLVHVENLRWRDRVSRGEYLNGVERTEGAEAARRLARAYVADWERRKAELKPFELDAQKTPRYA